MGGNTEVVIVPSISPSHAVPTIEFAKQLIAHPSSRISITFLMIPAPRIPKSYLDSVASAVPYMRFVSLPLATNLPPPGTEPGMPFMSVYVQNYIPYVKDALTELISDGSNSVRLIVDMFSSFMIDVGKELNIPSYIYHPAGAGPLGLMLHLPTLDSEISTELEEYSSELKIPSYVNPIPIRALPSFLLNKKSDSYAWALYHARKFGEAKGIIVDSFAELEPQAFDAFDRLAPRVHFVGPVLDLQKKAHDQAKYDRVMSWLDDQPGSSVIYLCFGSRGILSEKQVKELAIGLEQSGHRFLLSMRGPPKAHTGQPSDYTNPEQVLPEGFLDRIGQRGLVCGWAPQVEVLAHKAVVAFVSHCGWNSILESLWFGVPILTWPIDAEQNLNAVQLVKDLGLAVELKEVEKELVEAEVIERGVRCIMDDEGEVRRRAREISGKCREALKEGGSSWSTLGSLVQELNTFSVVLSLSSFGTTF